MYLTVGVQLRQRRERALAPVEPVPGHRAAVAGERVVEHQADLDQQRAALFGPPLLVGEQPERRRQDARKRRVDRNRGLQRPNVVRRVLQQAVAFVHRFVDEAEFAVLEVADAAVDHVGRRARCSGKVVASLDECDIDSLQCEVAERGNAVDSAADDQDVGGGSLAQLADVGALVRIGGPPAGSHGAGLPFVSAAGSRRRFAVRASL